MPEVHFERGSNVAVDVEPYDAFYKHGWHSWSPSGWVDPHEPVRPIADEGRRLGHDDPLHSFDTSVGGSGVGVVGRCGANGKPGTRFD